jgi:hypothetical protein
MAKWRLSRRLAARTRPWSPAVAQLPAKTRRKKRADKIEPPKVSEFQLHRTVAELLDWLLAPPAMYTTFPAGWGKLTKRTAGMLHGSGLKRGMPDILVFYNCPANRPRCIGIELKAKGRSLSAVQRAMAAQLQRVGVKVYVCHDTDEVIDALRRADVPRRAIRTGGIVPLGIELENTQMQSDADPATEIPRFKTAAELDAYIQKTQRG